MINKYRWWELVLIYSGIAVFLVFILAPFLEAFVVSLRPIDAIFSIPYRFITEDMSPPPGRRKKRSKGKKKSVRKKSS